MSAIVGSLVLKYTYASARATMLNAEAWFPPTGPGNLPPGLAPGVSDLAAAIQAMVSSPQTISSQLPVGLGAQSAAFDKVFVDTFTQIVLGGAAPGPTLSSQATTLQGILQQAGAHCWKPDPDSAGVCKVG